ncbi:MAG: hypothetical protein H0W86_13865 [Armatimonadetes bacterium]|nr:hypothetical protein [Armatimonadota bacterium]
MTAWAGQTYTGWIEFIAEQAKRGETLAVFGKFGYLWPWLQATLENWQSEWLQLMTFVLFTTFLIHKGSHESKDADEAMQAALDRIEQKVESLEKGNVQG